MRYSAYNSSGVTRYSGDEDGTYYMSYNHKNERTVRSSNTSGDWYSNAVQFVYDESSNLLGEYAPDGTPLVEYVWIDNRPVAAIYGTGESTKIYAVVTDHNNTPRMLVNNATDEIVWDWKSTAFGVGQPTGSVTFNLRFPGQYYDKYTGLHYNLNRYYNPELGRYMEPDPIGLEGGSNPYVYAGNNPISYVDPSGLDYSFINESYFNNTFNDGGFNSFTYNTMYSFNNVWTFGLWDNFNNWYFDGSTGYDPRSSGANAGNIISMAVTGPVSLAKKGTAVAATELKTLYHYTDDAGLKGILNSRQLNASLKELSPKDARYGNGQYLSDITPGTRSCAQLSSCFLGIPWQGKKYTNYVEINVTGLNVMKGRHGVYVIPNGKPLDISKRIISSGRN